ncbi:MAG: VOC family protein [Myxococcales bacterium]|nr:VOC family protein [Myxococcales bacterium]
MSEGFRCVAARAVLGSTDLERTRATWCGVLGFEVAVTRRAFLLLRSGDAEVAFRPDPAPAPHRISLEVRDVDVAFACARDGGVQIVSELHTHDSGRRDFVVRDPDGHLLEVVEPPHHGGHVVGIELAVEDATTSRDFWAHVAGFDGVEAMSMGDWTDFALTTDGRVRAVVSHRRGEHLHQPPVWMVRFAVDALDQALSEVEARGGAVLERHPRSALVRGPNGAVAALVQE